HVVGVRRLPQLEGHVVRDVHDVVAGTQAQRGQAPLQPHGAGSDAHAVDAAQREARARRFVAYLDGQAVVDVRVAGVQPGGRVLHPPPELRAQVAGDAEERERVGAVRGQLELD